MNSKISERQKYLIIFCILFALAVCVSIYAYPMHAGYRTWKNGMSEMEKHQGMHKLAHSGLIGEYIVLSDVKARILSGDAYGAYDLISLKFLWDGKIGKEFVSEFPPGNIAVIGDFEHYYWDLSSIAGGGRGLLDLSASLSDGRLSDARVIPK